MRSLIYLRALIFFFIFAASFAFASGPKIEQTQSSLNITYEGKTLLHYHTGKLAPPNGQPQHYARSAFIHPLNTLSGSTLTGIHPEDHVHHMGLWHAWVKSVFEGEERDFWNLDRQHGSVEFIEVLSAEAKEKAAQLKLKQAHYIYSPYPNKKHQVLDEILALGVTINDGFYYLDYSMTQTNISDKTLSLLPYRYGGGIAFRSRLDWGLNNSDYLTSEGKTRSDGHATRAKWVRMHGPGDNSNVSLVIFNHPQNFDSPQRVRIWDQGPMFFNYVPTQEHGLEISPNQTLKLRYRIMIADEILSPDTIESAYRDYSKQAAN